jgi:hypothetical protein
MSNFKLDDSYVDVAERIREFKAAFPEGSLQPVDHDNPYILQEIGNETLIVYRAAAYRTPDDPRPGIGVASEVFPGRTPYTKGSEIMNAETSAWGRAIVALGIPTKRIASTEEVRNRRAEQATPQATRRDEQGEQAAAAPAKAGNGNGRINAAAQKRLGALIEQAGRDVDSVLAAAERKGLGGGTLDSLTMEEAKKVAAAMKKIIPDPEPPEGDGADPTDGNDSPDDYKPQEAATAAPADVASPAAREAREVSPGASGDGFEEFDAELSAAAEKKRAENASKDYKVGSITAQQLTRIAAQCGELERLGVGVDEWRIALADKFSVAHRDALNKTTAPKVIDFLRRWTVDLKSGVLAPGEREVA